MTLPPSHVATTYLSAQEDAYQKLRTARGAPGQPGVGRVRAQHEVVTGGSHNLTDVLPPARRFLSRALAARSGRAG